MAVLLWVLLTLRAAAVPRAAPRFHTSSRGYSPGAPTGRPPPS